MTVRRVAGGFVALLLVLVGVPTGVGALLPRTHTARSQVELPQACPEVFAVVTDVARWPAWNSATDEVRLDPDGRRFVQIADGDALAIHIEEVQAPTRYRTRIEDNPVFGGTWTFELAGDGPCAVTLTEEGFVGPWPVRAIVALLGHHGTIDQTLRDLSTRFGAAGEPRHLP